MGGTASTLSEDPESKLDVLQPGKPLAILLECGSSAGIEEKHTRVPSMLAEDYFPQTTSTEEILPQDEGHAGSSPAAKLRAPPSTPSQSAQLPVSAVLDADEETTPADASASSEDLPRDLDHEFWSSLFHDFVVFHAAASSAQRASVRALSAAVNNPEGKTAGIVALTVRAALCRVRDYVASSRSSFPRKEVLGALLLAGQVLTALVELNPTDHTLCLILGASAAEDCARYQQPPMTKADTVDIGQSVLWQLVTSSLDCITHTDDDPVASNIVLASICVVFVVLSGTYLASQDGAMNADPLSPAKSSSRTRTPGGGRGHDPFTESPNAQDNNGESYRSSERCPHSLLAAIVDRYSNPSSIVCGLLDLALDAVPNNDEARRSATVLAAPTDSRSGPGLSTDGGFGPRIEATRNEDRVLAPGSNLVARTVSPVTGVLYNGAATGASLVTSLMGRLPVGNGMMLPPSLLWYGLPGSGGGVSPRDTSNDVASPRSASSSETGGSPLMTAKRPAPTGPRTPKMIPRSPRLLGEQALALLAVLCAPRSPAAFAGTDAQRHPSAAESQPDPGATNNPYRFALQNLHDYPPRDAKDENVYSFPRLYEVLSSWVRDARGTLVAYYLVISNRRFRTFVLARTDPDVLLVPLLHALYERSSAASPPAPADAYMPAIIALVLTSDQGFCSAIDDVAVPISRIPWFEDRARIGSDSIRLSGLVLLVCIRSVQQSLLPKRRVLETYLASLCVAVMANISPTATCLSTLAADRLIALIEFVGKRHKKAVLVALHEVDAPKWPDSSDATERQEGPAGDADKTRAEATGKGEVSFQFCSSHPSHANSAQALAELLGTLLEVVASVLRARSNVSTNKHLMYGLLHREAVFSAEYVSEVSPRTRAIASRIRGVVAYFGEAIEEQSRGPSSASLHAGDAVAATSGDTVQDAAAPALGGGLSIESVFSGIERFGSSFPRTALDQLPEVGFEFVEAAMPESFCLPYAWVLAMRDSPLRWDSAQFPNATLPLASSVFHPPRPPHGAGVAKR